MGNSAGSRLPTGSKVAVSARVPVADRDWLRDQAKREQRDTGVVLARAIRLYRLACEADGFDTDAHAAPLPLQGAGLSPQALPVGSTPPAAKA